MKKFILVCWLLIVVKHVAVIWAVHHYAVPFHQLWMLQADLRAAPP